MTSLIRRSCLLASLAPPLHILWLIAHLGVLVPLWDQWALAPLLLKSAQDGGICLADLWAQHNEHRLVIPRLLMLANGLHSGWDISHELHLTWFVAFLTLGLVVRLIHLTCDEPAVPPLTLLASILIFSPVQFENWLWGWQTQILLSNLGLFGALAALTEWPGQRRGVALAAGCCLLASLSFANGLTSWLAAGLLLAAQPRTKHQKLLWGALALAVLGLYLWDFKMPAKHQAGAWSLALARSMCGYALTWLGATLGGYRISVSMAAGALLVLSLLGWARVLMTAPATSRTRSLTWACLIASPLTSAAMTAYGRAHFGCEQALTSRYTTLSTPLLLAVIVLISQALCDPSLALRRHMRIWGVCCLVAFASGGSITWLGASEHAEAFSQDSQRCSPWLDQPEMAWVDTSCLHLPSAVVAGLAHRLQAAGFLRRPSETALLAPSVNLRAYVDVVGNEATAHDASMSGSDRVQPRPEAVAPPTSLEVRNQGTATLHASLGITLQGWAFAANDPGAARGTWIELLAGDRTLLVPCCAERRPDVVAALRLEHCLFPGWQTTIRPRQVPPGTYQVAVRVLLRDRRTYARALTPVTLHILP